MFSNFIFVRYWIRLLVSSCSDAVGGKWLYTNRVPMSLIKESPKNSKRSKFTTSSAPNVVVATSNLPASISVSPRIRSGLGETPVGHKIELAASRSSSDGTRNADNIHLGASIRSGIRTGKCLTMVQGVSFDKDWLNSTAHSARLSWYNTTGIRVRLNQSQADRGCTWQVLALYVNGLRRVEVLLLWARAAWRCRLKRKHSTSSSEAGAGPAQANRPRSWADIVVEWRRRPRQQDGCIWSKGVRRNGMISQQGVNFGNTFETDFGNIGISLSGAMDSKWRLASKSTVEAELRRKMWHW